MPHACACAGVGTGRLGTVRKADFKLPPLEGEASQFSQGGGDPLQGPIGVGDEGAASGAEEPDEEPAVQPSKPSRSRLPPLAMGMNEPLVQPSSPSRSRLQPIAMGLVESSLLSRGELPPLAKGWEEPLAQPSAPP